MTAANLAGRLLFLTGSVLFLALSLSRERPVMAVGSALFVAGSLLFLALQVRQLRSPGSAGPESAPAGQEASGGGVSSGARRTEV